MIVIGFPLNSMQIRKILKFVYYKIIRKLSPVYWFDKFGLETSVGNSNYDPE